MKKLIMIALACVLALSVCGCAKAKQETAPADAEFSAKFVALLEDIRDNFHPGTAGASLKGAKEAAEAADLFAQYKPTAEQVKQCVKTFKEEKVDADSRDLFDEQLDGIVGSFSYITGEDGEGILADAGYQSAGLDWDDDVAKLFEAMSSK